MNKITNHLRSADEQLCQNITGIQIFEKQLANLRRFSGTENDATFLIRRRLNDPNNEKVILVAIKEELYEKARYQETWEKARALPLSAAQFLEAFSFTYLYLYLENFSLQYKNGTSFPIPDVDSLVGNDTARCRTISNYLEADETGLNPKRITRKGSLLQTIDLVARTYDAVCSFAKK